MQIIIEKAQETDFDKVHEILMHKDVNPFMNYPILSKDDFKEVWREIFSRLYLWKENTEILGIVVITKGTHRVKHIAYIDILATNQSLRRGGVGTAFFNKVIESLAAEGFIKIELSVEVDNDRAVTFYKKMGFVIEGVRKKSLNREGKFIDNYFMAKML